MSKLEIKTAIQVAKPSDLVFQSIIDPNKMSNYFISWASGKIEEGKNIEWKFPEFKGSFPIHVKKIDCNKCIYFTWEGAEGFETHVEITLAEKDKKHTIVSITEKSMSNNNEGIIWLKRNTEGWANFLACMKAYLEFGINLRKGGFDFLKEE